MKEIDEKNGYLEDLPSILDRIIVLTDNCDSKCSIVFGVGGVVMSILLSGNYFSNLREASDKIKSVCNLGSLILPLSIISMFTLFTGLIFLFFVIVPTTDPKKFDTTINGKDAPSLMFFKSIARKKDFDTYLKELTHPGSSERSAEEKCSSESGSAEKTDLKPWQEDYLSQIYSCSKICNNKFNLFLIRLYGAF